MRMSRGGEGVDELGAGWEGWVEEDGGVDGGEGREVEGDVKRERCIVGWIRCDVMWDMGWNWN